MMQGDAEFGIFLEYLQGFIIAVPVRPFKNMLKISRGLMIV
jgi:hypothetical protein